MKTKTSITLSTELLYRLDRLIGAGGNRSAVMEEALSAYLTDRERRLRDARDRNILEQKSRELARESRDVIGYQDGE